ncbi:S-layer homology domain-containing protein [Paenibacillus sp. CAU 1782]
MKKKQRHGTRIISCLLAVLLIAGLIPAGVAGTASAASAGTVHAAAYMGAESAEGTTLPASVEIDGQSKPVDWHIAVDSFAIPYDTVAISGTAEGGIPVAAQVLIVPPANHPLVYFVDSGRGGDSVGNGPSNSPFYNELKALAEGSLLNDAPDQRFAQGVTEWGFDDSVHKVKNSKDGGHTDPATDPSIWTVGLRVDPSSNHIVYRLKALQPGTYTLSSGFHDWYGTRSRSMQPVLQYKDTEGSTVSLALDSFNTNVTKMISSEFTVPESIDESAGMTLTYTYLSGEKPILSWFGIAEGGIKSLIEDAKQAAAATVRVVLDGNDIPADNINGLTFKGFGVLSANSTSALLLDYKSQHPEAYVELLKILFGGERPIMTHVKIEMGNDRNNSTGPDPATKRTADEPANVTRHPGFQLAADAKAVNPDLKVSILRWNAPAWANNSNDRIYDWYKETILTAYRQYGYMVDYVNPHINEHAPDLNWTKQYANRVKIDSSGFASAEEKNLYNSIKAVISDEVGIGSFGGSMVSDASLREAVPIAGYHYNTDDDSTGNFKRLAEEYGIEIWNSEAQATFSNSAFRPNNNTKDPSVEGTGIGGVGSALEMGNTIIKGFVNSRRTHFIYQPAIGSFYEGGQYSFKELVSARDPWSGWIHYDAGLSILQHFSWFANIGWEPESNDAGIWRAVPKASYTGATGTNPVNGRNGTPSYMTMAAPDRSGFSTVIVNDSEYERIYKLQAVHMDYAGAPSLEQWETRAAGHGEAFNRNYMQYLGKVNADGAGVYTVRVKPFSIKTVTTLENSGQDVYQQQLPVEGERTVLDTDLTGEVQNTGDRILYGDDFDYTGKTVPVIGAGGEITGSQSFIESRGGSGGAIPRYTHDRNGAFEAYLDESSGNYVLRQQLDREAMGLGGTWNNGEPVTAIGDYRWTNYKASVDVSFERNSTYGGANYAAIGARYQGGGSSHSISGTPYVLKFWFDGGWQLLVNNVQVAGGNVASGTGGVKIEGFDTSHDAWHKLSIEVAGNLITASIDGEEVASHVDASPKLSGRVDLASGYYFVRFDNLLVETIDGYAPYYSEALDDLEKHDLGNVPSPKLQYRGQWDQRNGQGMYHYQRSLSTSKSAGAELEYTFTGTGLDILGPNDGSAKLEVIVDGEIVALAAGTMASRELYQTYSLRGLSYGQHTVSIKVVSGTLTIDAVAVVSGEVKGLPDVTLLLSAHQKALDIARQPEFRESDWLLFQRVRDAAEEALDNPTSYRLDQEGADQLTSRLAFAESQLYTGDIRTLSSPHYSAVYVGGVPALPAQVEATREDGNKTMVPITWQLDGASFNNAYDTVRIVGKYGSLESVAYVEVVPEDLLYFVDVNATAVGVTAGHSAGSTLGYDSPAYKAIAELASSSGTPLLNGAPDQVFGPGKFWGHGAANASGSLPVSYKGIVAGPYSKQSTTGIYTSNQIGAALTYTFDDVPAGEYEVTIGSYSWWAAYSRTAQVQFQYGTVSETAGYITLNNASFDAVRTYPLSKTDGNPLTVKLAAITVNESPMLSFIGLARVKAVQPEDTVKPVITLLGEVEVTLPFGGHYSDAGATAGDDRDGDISGKIAVVIKFNGNPVDALNPTVAGTYTFHYKVSDTAGNEADEVIRTVIVEEAITPTPTPTPGPTESPGVTPGPTESPGVTPGPTESPGVTPGPTESPGVTPAPTESPGVTPAPTESPGVTPGPTESPGVTPGPTESPGVTPGPTESPGVTPSPTESPGVTPSPTESPGVTPAPTIVPGPIWTPTSTPAPTPAATAKPSQLIAGSGNLTDEGEGVKGIKLSAIEKSVLLQLAFTKSITGEQLRIANDQGSVELSHSLLNELLKAMETAGAEGVVLQWFAEQSRHDFTRLANQTLNDDTLSLTAASDLFRFAINEAIHDVMNRVALQEPVTLAFKVDDNANPDLLGVYLIGEDGTLHYAGGAYRDGYMIVEVAEYGSYGVLEYNKSFLDVGQTMWAFNVIQMLAAKHIVQGGSDSKFQPQAEVTRAEFAAMLVRALGLRGDGEPGFADVDRNKWYAEAITAAVGAGIVNGRSSSSFAPEDTVSREEMVVMLIRAFEYAGGKATGANGGEDELGATGNEGNVSEKDLNLSDNNLKSQILAAFDDASLISEWAMESTSQALEFGLIKGRGNDRFEPLETLTRAEAAQVIVNLLKLIAK